MTMAIQHLLRLFISVTATLESVLCWKLYDPISSLCKYGEPYPELRCGQGFFAGNCPKRYTCTPLYPGAPTGICCPEPTLFFPCLAFDCPAGTACENTYDHCNNVKEPCIPAPVCESIDPCLNTTCPPGLACRREISNCSDSPCPSTVQCDIIDPCLNLSCPAGLACQKTITNCPDPPCPTDTECAPIDPCLNFTCPVGTQCRVNVSDCSTPPCPPTAECDPIDLCVNTTCPTGTTCNTKTVDCPNPPCPTFADCDVLDQCSSTICGVGQTCVQEPAVCSQLPCPLEARCDFDFCAFAMCEVGGRCRRLIFCQQILCPIFECVPICNSGGNSGVHCNSSIALSQCESGYICTEENGSSEDACCPQDCTSPADPGSCGDVIPRYYYDSTSGQCELFFYSGCSGNNNNWETKEQCTAACILY